MKAGRELDRLVQEHIIGEMVVWEEKPFIRARSIGDDDIQHYSSNISDAWQIIEKLKDKVDIGIFNDSLGNWNCKILDKSDWSLMEIEAKTAPLAICLTALKVVGVEIDD